MNKLPQGWITCKIEDIASNDINAITDGPFGSSLKSIHYTSAGIRVIRLTNIGYGKFIPDDTAFVDIERWDELQRHNAIGGDLVTAALGNPLGRTCMVPESNTLTIVKSDCFRLRASSKVDARLILHFINSPDVMKSFSDRSQGIGRERINLGMFRETQISLPPISEQRRIVAKIDNLSIQSIRARKELEKARILISKYKEAFISRLFERKIESNIVLENKKTSITTYLSDKIRNGLSVSGSDFPPGVPALKLSALRSNIADLSEVRYLPIDGSRAMKFYIMPSDILVSRGNGALRLVGKAAIVPEKCDGIIFPDTAFRLRLNHAKVDARWLLWMWNSPQMRSQIESAAKTTAGIWKISQADISSFELPYMDIEEQRDVVLQIDTKFRALDRIILEIENANRLIERLDQSILEKAFRGELVPQDPNDEPASVLLDRIQAERAAAGPAPKRGRRPRTAPGA